MNLKDLSNKFNPEDIEWRLQQCGEKNGKIWAICLAYITNRAIMERLDEVCGPENWKNEYASGPHGGVMCGLSINIAGEWVTKWDGAENTDIEPVKGGLSGAMKRAAVQWGIGRYLYQLEEGFAVIAENGAYRGKTKENKHFNWNPPTLPSWALPTSATDKKQVVEKQETKAEVETKAQENKITAYFNAMKAEKERAGEEGYYKMLGIHGYENANQVPPDKRKDVYAALKTLKDKEKVK